MSKRPILAPDALRASPGNGDQRVDPTRPPDHLLLNSPKSLVSLARTRRGLEKQTPSVLTLWSERSRLAILLLEVPYNWALYPPFSYHHRYVILIVTWLVLMGVFTPQGLNVSWMRWLDFGPALVLEKRHYA